VHANSGLRALLHLQIDDRVSVHSAVQIFQHSVVYLCMMDPTFQPEMSEPQLSSPGTDRSNGNQATQCAFCGSHGRSKQKLAPMHGEL
jgi:hypothetical protein